jgi:hypothetical protein
MRKLVAALSAALIGTGVLATTARAGLSFNYGSLSGLFCIENDAGDVIETNVPNDGFCPRGAEAVTADEDAVFQFLTTPSTSDRQGPNLIVARDRAQVILEYQAFVPKVELFDQSHLDVRLFPTFGLVQNVVARNESRVELISGTVAPGGDGPAVWLFDDSAFAMTGGAVTRGGSVPGILAETTGDIAIEGGRVEGLNGRFALSEGSVGSIGIAGSLTITGAAIEDTALSVTGFTIADSSFIGTATGRPGAWLRGATGTIRNATFVGDSGPVRGILGLPAGSGLDVAADDLTLVDVTATGGSLADCTDDITVPCGQGGTGLLIGGGRARIVSGTFTGGRSSAGAEDGASGLDAARTAVLAIEGGTFRASDSLEGAPAAVIGGRATISGGLFEGGDGVGGSVIDSPGSGLAVAGGTVEITGGTIRGGLARPAGSSAPIRGRSVETFGPESALVVEGGLLEGDLLVSEGVAEIRGGTIVGDLIATLGGVIDLAGGTVTGDLVTTDAASLIRVRGRDLAVMGGLLTGTLLDGTPIALRLSLASPAALVLTPLPPAGLLAAGGLVVLAAVGGVGRRRARAT